MDWNTKDNLFENTMQVCNYCFKEKEQANFLHIETHVCISQSFTENVIYIY